MGNSNAQHVPFLFRSFYISFTWNCGHIYAKATKMADPCRHGQFHSLLPPHSSLIVDINQAPLYLDSPPSYTPPPTSDPMLLTRNHDISTPCLFTPNIISSITAAIAASANLCA